jgi:hypothetical protein
MIGLVLIIYIVPWADIYSIPWYNNLIEFESRYFPNIDKIRAELGVERSKYYVAQLVFINIVEWPIFVYVLYRIKPADKVVTGEFTRVFLVLSVGLVLVISSLFLMTSSGVSGGKLSNTLSQSNLGLTVMSVLKLWGGFYGWTMLLSTTFGLIKKHRLSSK